MAPYDTADRTDLQKPPAAAPAAPGDVPLTVRGLTVAYGDKPAIEGVDATVVARSMTAVIGPNGAGKSTLLKAALGIVTPIAGTVRMFGQPVGKVRGRIAYVPQRASVDWDFPARAIDVVLMGYWRRLGLLRPVGRELRAKAFACLDRVGMADFADRQIGRLSGGQQQRVFLARALAQDADLYLLDEPFAGVDAATERAIVDVLKALEADRRTVVAVHHDLSTVRAYFDRVLLVNRTTIAEGSVQEAFTAEALQATYGGRLAGAHLGAIVGAS